MGQLLEIVGRGEIASGNRRAPNTDRILFSSCLLRIGSFRCAPDHPLFNETGPTETHVMVFPRTSVWIAQVDRPPFVGAPTHAALYNAGHAFVRRRISPEGDRSDWFGLAPALLYEVFAEARSPAVDADELRFTTGQASASGELYRRQRTVFEYVRRTETADVIAVEEAAIGILRTLLGSTRRSTPRPAFHRQRELVENAKAHLAIQSSRRESLADVSAALGCSVFHLCRTFRAHTGSSLHAYRRRLRVRRALERVIETDEDLLSVGLSLGFSGHSHFTATFKREFGIVPSELRHRGRNELRRLLDDARRRIPDHAPET
jgi:AraC-like DNA-binding protein